MSDNKKRIPIAEAEEVAGQVISTLEPFCDRIEVAGSIRRKCGTVGDVEVVCIPSEVDAALLFDTGEKERDPRFLAAVNRWEKVKGDPSGKYTQRIHLGAKIDIFMATPENWGLILAIRTGPAEYSHNVLAAGWEKKGYHSVGGVLHRGATYREIREEHELFDLLGIRPVPKPQVRRWQG